MIIIQYLQNENVYYALMNETSTGIILFLIYIALEFSLLFTFYNIIVLKLFNIYVNIYNS